MNPWRVGYRMTKPRYWSYLILPMKIWRNWKIDQYFSQGQLKFVVQPTEFENLQQTSFLASMWVTLYKVVKRDATSYIPTETQRLYPDKRQIWSFGESQKISETPTLTRKFSDIRPSGWCHCHYGHVIFAMQASFAPKILRSVRNWQRTLTRKF